MIIDLEYVREVSGVKYGLNVNNITRLKSEDKVQVEGQVKMGSDSRALNRI